MIIILSPSFEKVIRKMPSQLRERFKDRRDLFMQDSRHPLLNNHKLHGEYDGCRSINITGNIRAIYIETTDAIIFIAIGTHNELYE